ncbi:MAG: hypothetical protein QME51_10005 [Planctomycetota bacterium]|nr:hypothetical protein [Planctomycetota bacterium]
MKYVTGFLVTVILLMQGIFIFAETTQSKIILQPKTGGIETFSTGEIKSIPHSIFWNKDAVSGYFVQGYVKITFDPQITEVTGVQPGLFNAWILKQENDYVIIELWYWFNGTIVSDPRQAAFTATFNGKQDGSTQFNYEIVDRYGSYRGWFYNGRPGGRSGLQLCQIPVEVRFYLPGADITPPEIIIDSPVQGDYTIADIISISYQVTDAESELVSQTAELNGTPVINNTNIDATKLIVGTNTLIIKATNSVGLTSEKTISFNVTITAESFNALLLRYYLSGLISNKGIYNALTSQVSAVGSSSDKSAAGQHNALTNFILAQLGKKIEASTGTELLDLASIWFNILFSQWQKK